MDVSQINNPQIIDSLITKAQLVNLQGATCETYYSRMHGRRVFIKRLKEEYRLNPRYLSALEKEFNVGFKLEHKALPHYLLLEKDAIVMDYIDGVTLSQFIVENPTYFSSDKNVSRFMMQLLDCVKYLHQNSVLHLDLKPQNIIISHIDSDVRIVDLGFCYTDAYNDTTGYTNSFAAPELKNGKGIKIGSHTDIFSIGKILECILCGMRNHRYIKIAKKCQDEDISNRPDIATLVSYFSLNNKGWGWTKNWIIVGCFVIMPILGMIVYNQLEFNQSIEPNQLIISNQLTNGGHKKDHESNVPADTVILIYKNNDSIKKSQLVRLNKNTNEIAKGYNYPSSDYPFQSKNSTMEVKRDWYRELRPIYDKMLEQYMATDSMLWFNSDFQKCAYQLIENQKATINKKHSTISTDDIYNDGMHVYTMILWMHEGLPVEISGYKRPPRPDLTKYANEQIALFEKW